MAPYEEEELTWFTREGQLPEMNGGGGTHAQQQRAGDEWWWRVVGH
jgi:hypothetical protein